LDRPLPVMMGKAGRGSGKPLKGGVAHLKENMKEKERNKDYSRRSLTLVFIGVTCPEVEGATIHFSNGVVLQTELIG